MQGVHRADAASTAQAAHDDVPWPAEWWERWAERRAAWARRHRVWLRRLLVARLVLLAASLTWLVVASLLLVDVRQSMLAVYAGSVWVCVLWFLMLRTKTVSLSGMLRWFAASVLWSLVVGWALFRWAHTPDMAPSFTGPTTMIASFGEESLKLLPLAVLALVGPGRVRRFSVADWMLLGVVSGAAFECAEEIVNRVVAREQWGDALFLASNLTTFGLGGPSQPERDAFFPGHHVTTGLVACSVGLAVALWRRARRADAVGRLAHQTFAALLVAATWWSAVSIHAHVNLQGERLDLLPWPVRAWLTILPDSWGATWTLALVVAVVLAVDGHRLRSNGGWLFPLPVHASFVRVDDALAGLAAPTSAPGTARRAADSATDVVRSWSFVLADTVRGVTAFVAAGARRPGEPWWHAARAAQASVVATRRSRELVLHDSAPSARSVSTRLSAAGVVVAILVTAFPLARALARHVEANRDRGLGITRWLAGVLDRLGDWWDGLDGWEKVAVVGAAFALTALTAGLLGGATVGGALMTGVSGGSGVFTVVDNADHLADYARAPSTAAQKYWADVTPGSVLLDAGTLALTFWAPSRLAAPVRNGINDALFSRRARAALQPERRIFKNLAPGDPIREYGFESIGPMQLRGVSSKFNYVVKTDGELVMANQRYGHIDLAAGNDVVAAGTFRVHNGAIRSIDNASGHYRPHGPEAQVAAEEAFNEAGLSVPPTAYKEIRR